MPTAWSRGSTSTSRGRSARRAAISCTIQAREWDDTLNALRQGNADAIIAGIAITTAAREELDFSEVYMRWPGRFVVRRDAGPIDLTAPAGLKGKTLAVVARTAHEAYLAAFFPRRETLPDAGGGARRGTVRRGRCPFRRRHATVVLAAER